MPTSDPRYATYPQELGVAQLRWLIDNAAADRLAVQEFVESFRRVHEALERAGRSKYRSKDEARLIWDVLWALEFYSPDPSREQNPDEWNDAAAVLAEIKRVAEALARL